MPRFKDQAVCIRHIDWSETSQVVALITRDHGRIRGLAKGSRRTSPGAIARYCGGIDLLTRGEVIATTKPSTDLATITEWDLQDTYRQLRTDLHAHRLGMYGADLTGALTADHDPHPRVFDALVNFLEAIAGGVEKPIAPEAALLRFQWDVLVDCGFKPELNQDVVTGEPLITPQGGAMPAATGPMMFDPQAGGITLRAGATGAGQRVQDAGPWRVRGETIDLLRQLMLDSDPAAALESTSMENDAKAREKNSERIRRANRLLCVYTRSILDRELPTMRFVLE